MAGLIRQLDRYLKAHPTHLTMDLRADIRRIAELDACRPSSVY